MLSQPNEFLWGDKWGVENSTAWFVSGKFNVLFSVDMVRDCFKSVAVLPDDINLFRRNSNCIKCENTIFCMPDKGNCIWCYDLLTGKFQKIEIANPDSISVGIGDFWRCGEILWAVSVGLRQLLEIDIKKKKVIGYYKITDQKNENIARSAKDKSNIYITSASKGRIYIFSIEKKEVKIRELPTIKSGLRTISVDGKKVWLSGYKREIYIWNQDDNEIKVLNHFPLNFGIYNFDRKEVLLLDCEATEYNTFAFLESIDAGGSIWFIPFQTNQILYVNKNTNEIHEFEMAKEEEDEKSIKNREMNCKYILQYVYDDRYIGLYSLKNNMVFEIDTYTLEIKTRLISFDINELVKIPNSWILNESIDAEKALYWRLIGINRENMFGKEDVGTEIYRYIMKGQIENKSIIRF